MNLIAVRKRLIVEGNTYQMMYIMLSSKRRQNRAAACWLYEEDSPAETKQKHIDECYLKLYHLIRAMLFDLLELGMSF